MKRLRFISTSLSFFLVVLPASFSSLAVDLYVSPTGIGTNCSELNPCDLQTALEGATDNSDDDVIHLSAGTYDASTATFTYQPIPPENYAVTLEGAGSVAVILDGGCTNQILNIDTSSLTDDKNSHITIRDMLFQNGKSNSGGGVYITTYSANITLVNSNFTENSGTYGAGGSVIHTQNGVATLVNNTFNGNYGGNYGGGAWVHSSYGLVNVADNTFNTNSCYGGGGGVWVQTRIGQAILSNNTFDGNTSDDSGGGAYAISNSGTVTLTNNTFIGNTAKDYRGGGANVGTYKGTVTITNNTYNQNTSRIGGGIYIYLQIENAAANIFNNIVWDNEANQGGDIYVDDKTGQPINLYNNDYDGFYIESGDNLLEVNNINEDPLFVDPANGDLHLQSCSPCIDQGDPYAPALPDTDFEGDDRIIGDAPDIGADEYTFLSIVDIQDSVENLVDTGVLTEGQGNALIAKLAAAERMSNKGNMTAACNQLQAFINQIQAYINAGILSAEQAQSLIDAANEVINDVCG